MSSSGVAVVITCYELGRTLPDALDSVTAQTARAEEVVVVDDGSQDPLTQHVLARIEAELPDVRVIRSEHRGPAHARNTGVDATSAPLAVLLDGDDLFAPSYLERASRLLAEREDLTFVCCALQAFGRASYRWKPPPYTVAEAIGRGACGHISTVFRRDMWERVGRFDEELPAYEDLDFWLRAIELGYRGAILDEALLRYRVRPGSRYHDAVVQGRYVRAKEMLLERHREPVVTHGEDVLVALLDFEREITGHARSLHAEGQAIETVLQAVEDDVAAARARLEANGARALDWGELHPGDESEDPGEDWIAEHFLRRALADLDVDTSAKRTLVVRPGDTFPRASSRYDLILVERALETVGDPVAAIAACRGALRPGGRLVVAATALARGHHVRRGMTEASLRGALSEEFAPGEVWVSSYGNLLAALASVAGAPREAVDDDELERPDPWHPVLVVGAASAPARSRRNARERVRLPSRRVTRVAPASVILAYHRVADHTLDTHGLCTPPEVFAEHMSLVAEHHELMSLRELAARVTAGELSHGAVAVTFDDGYLDNLEIASPILTRLGIPATFFVNGPLDSERRETWVDLVERVLMSTEAVPGRLSLDAAGASIDVPTRTRAERAEAARVVHGRLLQTDPAAGAALVDELGAWSGRELTVRETHRLMTAEEVVALSEHPGHDVEAHGWAHLMLPEHPPEDRAADLRRIREGLADLLGEPPALLAYPYGACDFETTEIAEAAGFSAAFSVEPEAVTADSDPLRLPRLEVASGGPDELRFRLERAMTGIA